MDNVKTATEVPDPMRINPTFLDNLVRILSLLKGRAKDIVLLRERSGMTYSQLGDLFEVDPTAIRQSYEKSRVFICAKLLRVYEDDTWVLDKSKFDTLVPASLNKLSELDLAVIDALRINREFSELNNKRRDLQGSIDKVDFKLRQLESELVEVAMGTYGTRYDG